MAPTFSYGVGLHLQPLPTTLQDAPSLTSTTTVSSPLETTKIKNGLQMPHTLCKNNGLTRQAARLFEIHSQITFPG